jgi:hypothetical protein
MFGLEKVLSSKVVALALAETDLAQLQEWEVRAVACFLHERLPRPVRMVVSEIALEEAAEAQRRQLVAWYDREQPRSDAMLFGMHPQASAPTEAEHGTCLHCGEPREAPAYLALCDHCYHSLQAVG